jgi:hypothetical protein
MSCIQIFCTISHFWENWFNVDPKYQISSATVIKYADGHFMFILRVLAEWQVRVPILRRGILRRLPWRCYSRDIHASRFVWRHPNACPQWKKPHFCHEFDMITSVNYDYWGTWSHSREFDSYSEPVWCCTIDEEINCQLPRNQKWSRDSYIYPCIHTPLYEERFVGSTLA